MIRHPDGTTEEREVVGRLTVGADEGNDLVLRAHGVSQRHAQFFADGGELVLENVGSAAATLVDGETLGSPRKLKQGVRVLIGGYEVSLKPNQVSVRRLHPVASPERTLEDDAPPRAPAAAPGSTGAREHGETMAGRSAVAGGRRSRSVRALAQATCGSRGAASAAAAAVR